jgi:hypothetical protein
MRKKLVNLAVGVFICLIVNIIPVIAGLLFQQYEMTFFGGYWIGWGFNVLIVVLYSSLS